MSDQVKAIDHATFREQIAAALASGLSSAEQSAFDAHAAACNTCAAELNAARESEDRMTALFAPARPIPGFEDRIIHRLRLSARRRRFSFRPNWHIHPAVTKAVTGVAAAIVLAGFGYVATQMMDDGSANRMKTASHLREIGQGMSLYANDNKGGYLLYNYQNPYAGEAATGSGWKFNSTLGNDFSVPGDVNLGLPGLQVNGVENRPVDAGIKTGAGTVTMNGGTTDYFNRRHEDQKKQPPPPAIAAFGGVAAGDAGGQSPKNNPADSFGINKADTKTQYWDFYYADGIGKAGENTSGAPASGTQQLGRWFKPADVTQWGTAGKGHDFDGDDVKARMFAQEQQKALTEKEVRLNVDQAGKPVEVLRQQVAELGDGAMPAPPAAALGAPAPAPVEAPSAQVVAPPTAQPPTPEAPATQTGQQRKVIRNGQLEFEVDRFDSAFAQVSKLTTEAGGYVGTTDSEKLPNGKVKGTLTVRVPPDRLDTLVLQLRGIGDLKSQKMEAQDVSKHYSDMDSELRAARAMEERLLAIIKEGKGQIKDLLAAEKELGNWRTKIEKLVGEMKFLDNQVALSTLNITLFERDIKTPATAYENETIDSGVETEDVEKARADALKAIEEAKGRVIQSDLKRFDAGQFAATIIADVPADNAGPMLDRLKQLGKMARLDVQRKQTTADNAATAPGGAPVRVEKRDTRLNLSLYNLANVAPRQTTTLNIAADDVEAAYREILARVTKAGGRVITSNLARNKPEATTGTISFEVPSAEADAVKADVQAGAETMKLAVNDNPDVQNSTAAKRGFSITLASTASIAPRESATLQVAAVDVVAARDKILQAAGSTGTSSRVLATQLNANDSQNVNATIELDVRRGEALVKVEKAIADAGQTISRVVQRSTDTENTLDSKVHFSLALGPAEKLPPREMTKMAVELSDVESAMGDLAATAHSLGGRTVESNLSRSRDGQSTAHVVVDVPLDKAGEVIKHAKDLGAVRAIDSGKNLQVPAGALAKARIDVTFGNAEAIVSPDKGFWASIRRGFSTSVSGLMLSLQFIVVGLCFVLPWIAVIWVGWRVIKRRRQTPSVASA